MTGLPDKGWTKNSLYMLLLELRKFGTVDRRPGSGRRRWKSPTQLSRWCGWVRKTNLRANEQLQKSHVRLGSIDNDLRLKVLQLQEKGALNSWLKLPNSMHASFSVCSLTDDNVITSKPTCKHTNCILVFSVFLPNVTKNWSVYFELCHAV